MSHKGKDTVTRRISCSKLRKSIAAFTEWCRENRNNRIEKIVDMLNEKLRGYFNYCGVIGNSKGINEFYKRAKEILYKWLNRRSQKKSFNFQEFNKKMKWYGLISPKITEKIDIQLRVEECIV